MKKVKFFITLVHLWLPLVTLVNGQFPQYMPGTFPNQLTRIPSQQNFPRSSSPGFSPSPPNNPLNPNPNTFHPTFADILRDLFSSTTPQNPISHDPSLYPYPPQQHSPQPPQQPPPYNSQQPKSYNPQQPTSFGPQQTPPYNSRQPNPHNPLQPTSFGPQQPPPYNSQQPNPHNPQQPTSFGPQQPPPYNSQQPNPHNPQQPTSFGPQQPPPYNSQQPNLHNPQQPTSFGPQQPNPHNPQQPTHFGPQKPNPPNPQQSTPFGPQQPNSYGPQQVNPHLSRPPNTYRPQRPNTYDHTKNSPSVPSSQQTSSPPRHIHPQGIDPIATLLAALLPTTFKTPTTLKNKPNNPTVIAPQKGSPSPSLPDSDSQKTNEGPTTLQQTDLDSTTPQSNVETAPDSIIPQPTDSYSTVPQSTIFPSTAPQPTDSHSTKPESKDVQPITSATEPFSSITKPPQDSSPLITAPHHPHHSQFIANKPMDYEPSDDPLKGLRIVCIFHTIHYYKNGFTPAKLDPHLCTHLNYEFAILDPQSYEMITGKPDLDIDMNFYKEAIGLKRVNPKLKVLMSLGGWSDSTKKYSELAADEAKRKNFIEKAVEFLKKHGFDGMDLAWEYPNCWQGAIGVSPKDKPNFVTLLREIKREFKKHGLLLSVSVGAIKREVEAAYDVPEISKTVDYINVMTYDMHGPWESKTSHHVQFEVMPGDTDPYCNVKGGIQVWVEKGASKKKLNMGLAFYARTFRLKYPHQCGMGVPAAGPGAPGDITKEGGLLSYFELCAGLNAGNWTEKEDKHAGFYACLNIPPFDQFAAYDPPLMMVRKAKYVVEKGLGGVLMKDLSGDDSAGKCFSMPFPLVKMTRLEMIHKMRHKRW